MSFVGFPEAFVPNPIMEAQEATDAFGRKRVSQPQTVFDSKQTSNPGLLWTTLATGSGVVGPWTVARASTTLSVGAAAGRAVRQTRRRFHYQPGKSQLLDVTAVMGPPVPGVAKRVGQFDDANGLYFEQGADGIYRVVVRSSVSGSVANTPLTRDKWWFGSNRNGEDVIDLGKAGIFTIDYEWLGVGSVRFGLVPNGSPLTVAMAQHAGVLDSVYMSTPQLPIRYEIESTGITAGASLETICCSLMSEGGQDPTGILTAAASGSKALNTTTFTPLVQLQLIEGSGVTVLPEKIQAFLTANTEVEYALVLNPTVVGGIAADFQPAATYSGVAVDIAATGTITAGAWEHRLRAGFGTQEDGEVTSDNSAIAIGTRLDGSRDILTLCARALSSSPACRGAITWRELQ